MVESVGLACAKCTKITNVDLDEAKGYTKEIPFICPECLQQKPKEEPVSSRLQESERYSHPNLIEQKQESKPEEPSPALKKDNQIHIKIPKLETLEDYERAAVGEIKEKLDVFRHKREAAERDLAAEQTRVDNYGRQDRSSMIMAAIGVFIAMTVLLAIGMQVLGNVQPSVDCSKLPGSAGIHQTVQNASGWALNCLHTNQMIGNSMVLFETMLIVIVAIVILFVIRML